MLHNEATPSCMEYCMEIGSLWNIM